MIMPDTSQNHHVQLKGKGLCVYSAGLEYFLLSKLVVFRPDNEIEPKPKMTLEEINAHLREGKYTRISHSFIDRVLVNNKPFWISEEYARASGIRSFYDPDCKKGDVLIELTSKFGQPDSLAERILEQACGLLEKVS